MFRATVLLLLVLVAGCSSSSDDDQVATAGGTDTEQSADTGEGAAPAADPEERKLQWYDCLRDQGIDIDDSGQVNGGSGGQGDRAELAEAAEPCKKYAPQGVQQGAELSEDQKAQMLDYVDCLQDHGVEIADPQPDTGMPPLDDLKQLRDPDDDTQEAIDACKEFQPNVGGRR